MKEVLEQENISLSNKEKEQLIEKIENDKTLDMDTQGNAQKAVEIFSVDYDEAIKIAEVVNLLWEGKRRLEDELSFYKTRPQEDVFLEKVFPIAMEYKNIKDIEDIPKEIVDDIKNFKDSYEERFRIHKFNQDEELSELFKYVSDKIKNLKDSEREEILDKMDLVNYDMKTVDRKTVKFPEVWITEALDDYKKKQENIAERRENGFGIRGFENCEQISNEEVEEFLQRTFGKELLARALIAEVVYSSKFSITGEYNLLKEDEF